MEKFKKIYKKHLVNFILKKIKLDKKHVVSVVELIFAEIKKDIEDGKEFEIENFGTFWLQPAKEKKHFNVNTRQVEKTEGHPNLKFKLNHKFRAKIIKYLHVDRTTAGYHNGNEQVK